MTDEKKPYCSDWENYPEARANVVLRAEVGSTVYGTGRPGHEDHDEIAVFCMPPRHVLGGRPADSIVWRTAGASARSTPQDTDLAMYSVRKYVLLAAAGNPSILVPLFTPTEKVFESTVVGEILREQSGTFVTRQAGQKFLGYMDAQRKRMVDSRAGTRAPRSNRPELVAEHGFDTKFAMHMLRLGFQGIELLTTGRLELPIPDPAGELLRDVRRGKITYDEVMDIVGGLEVDLKNAILDADVKDMTPRADVDNLIWNLHWLHWDMKEYL